MAKPEKLGPLFIILAAFLWSLDGFLRQALYSLPSTLIVFLEHGVAFIFMVPLLIKGWPEIKKFKRSDWLAIFWIVAWGGIIGTVFYTKALGYVGYINLSVVVLLQKLQPIFAIGLAALFLKERLTKKFLGWAALALIGGYLVTFKDLAPNFATGSKTAYAALLAIGAAFGWGSSTVFGKRALRHASFKTITSLRFGVTALVMLIIVSISNNLSTISTVSSKQWWYLLAIAFSTGGVAMIIYYYGLKRVKASISTICELFWPVSAVIMDFFINKTRLAPSQWLGAALLLVAIYQVSVKRTNSIEQQPANM